VILYIVIFMFHMFISPRPLLTVFSSVDDSCFPHAQNTGRARVASSLKYKLRWLMFKLHERSKCLVFGLLKFPNTA
jgi:hypothetical protein